VALTGGLVELEVFPEAGDSVVVDEEIAFSTTKKNMKYFLSPLAGVVREANAEATAEALNEHPYDAWLVKLTPAPGWEGKLLDAESYAGKLAMSEHATEAAAQAGKAGKGSPTCKSIYSGIKET
jgi:glycine cleavage system H lipoate-binding protein